MCRELTSPGVELGRGNAELHPQPDVVQSRKALLLDSATYIICWLLITAEHSKEGNPTHAYVEVPWSKTGFAS